MWHHCLQASCTGLACEANLVSSVHIEILWKNIPIDYITCSSGIWWVSEYCFTSFSAQSWQYRDRKKPKVRNMPYSYRMTSRVPYSTQYHRQHCTLRPLNRLQHCECTTTMTNSRPCQDLNPVPSSKSQPNRINHRGRPFLWLFGAKLSAYWPGVYLMLGKHLVRL